MNRLNEPPVNFSKLCGVVLGDFAIVRHEAVDFTLDIGRLRVNRGGQSLLH